MPRRSLSLAIVLLASLALVALLGAPVGSVADEHAPASPVDNPAVERAVDRLTVEAAQAEERRRSPAARAERRRSRTVFARLTDTDARAVLEQKFPELALHPAWSPPRLG